MTTAPPSPVREPAWQLSRSAIGLWVTEGVIASVFLGARHRRVPRCSCRPSVGGPVPVLRWLVPIAVAGLRGRRHRHAALGALPGAPLGGHRRRGLHAHRLAHPHLDAGADLPHPDRRRHPRRAAAAVRAVDGRRADRVVAGHRARSGTWRPTSPSGWPTTSRTGRSRSATRRHEPRARRPADVAARRRSCTPSPSARRGSSSPRSSRSWRPPASAAGRRPSSRSSSASPCSRWSPRRCPGGGSATSDGPSAVVVTRGLLSRSVRTVPNDRIRGVEVEAPALHRLFGLVRVRIDAAAGSAGEQRRGARGRRRPARRGRPAADRRPHATGPPPAPAGDGGPARRAGRRRSSPASTTAGCSTPRWSAATSPCPLAAVGALLPAGRRAAAPVPARPRRTRPLRRPASRRSWSSSACSSSPLGSVVGAAVVNWGFRLVRRGGSLIAIRGLITRRHTELEIDRIRGCTLSEGLGMRWVRAARVSALVTGLGDAARRGQLLPLGPRAEAWTLAHGGWSRTPARCARIRPPPGGGGSCGRSSAGLLVTARRGRRDGDRRLVVGARRRARAHRARRADRPRPVRRARATSPARGSFTVRSGWLVREQAVLQRRAVVGWQVRQSFFQRRAGLATVLACVGAGQRRLRGPGHGRGRGRRSPRPPPRAGPRTLRG